MLKRKEIPVRGKKPHKIKLFVIFFLKNLHTSKKSSTFADVFARNPIFREQNTIKMVTKRIVMLAFVSTVFACGVVCAEESRDTEKKGVHPYKTEENTNVATDFSHWSLTFDAGINHFDGDFDGVQGGVYAPALGIGLEYTFNPYIGLGINYGFDMYHVKAKPTFQEGAEHIGEVHDMLNGHVHRAGLYLPVDLVSCFAPNATKRLFCLQLIVGGGMAWYKNDLVWLRGEYESKDPQSDYAFAPYFNFGVNLEFNVSRSVGLGIRGMYNYFTSDDLDARRGEYSAANDGLLDVTVSLRYKINAQKRNHERNVSSLKVERVLSGKVPDTGANAEDVAREILDKELLKTDKDTVWLVQKDTVVVTEQAVSEGAACGEIYFVYFKNGANFTDQGLIAVQQLAMRMQCDTATCAIVTGYCDATGPEWANDVVSQRRAKVVERELVEEYGIEPERLCVYGAGAIVSKRNNKAVYVPNRRVEVRLLSKQEFEQEKEGLVADKNSAEEKVVVVTGGTTLAQLAREFYGDSAQWKRIYDANKEVIKDPNILVVGMKLVIPAIEQE